VANGGRGDVRSPFLQRRSMATWTKELMRAGNKGGHRCLQLGNLSITTSTCFASTSSGNQHSPVLDGRRSIEPSTARSRHSVTRGF
jgi:hypothetical protein